MLIDQFADTLELPISGDFVVPESWEHDCIAEHLDGQYQVVREIGRGGMGVVFLARDIALHRLVAIKVLRYEYASSPDHRERFRREARMTARLSHANIVPVYAFGEQGDFVFIVMKYVHGESLAASRLPLAPTRVRQILHDLALALDSAHRDGVIHRDLKAENILLEGGSDRAMLTDFGVALLRSLDPVRADASHAFGTPHYMSPEQAAGELDIDGRSDIYSLGVLGYLMLSGRLPFRGKTFESLAAQHVAAKPASLAGLTPSAPSDLVVVIERCMEKDRADRFRSGQDLAAALGPKGAKRRWLSKAATHGKFAAELAVLVAGLRAALSWMSV